MKSVGAFVVTAYVTARQKKGVQVWPGDDLNVWYDREGDHLEIVFDEKAGSFEDTSLEYVMRKRDAEGNLLAISVLNLSSLRGDPTTPGIDLLVTTCGGVFNLDVDDPDSFEFDVALGYERLEAWKCRTRTRRALVCPSPSL